jgi:hypothetical protein
MEHLRGPCLHTIIRPYPWCRLWYLDSRLVDPTSFFWMMCLLLIIMRRLFNYLSILASVTQQQIQLAGQHGVDQDVALFRAQSSLITAAIAAIAI